MSFWWFLWTDVLLSAISLVSNYVPKFVLRLFAGKFAYIKMKNWAVRPDIVDIYLGNWHWSCLQISIYRRWVYKDSMKNSYYFTCKLALWWFFLTERDICDFYRTILPHLSSWDACSLYRYLTTFLNFDCEDALHFF